MASLIMGINIRLEMNPGKSLASTGRGKRYDYVILSGGPFMHFGIAGLIKETWHAKVIMDFRDPFARNARFGSQPVKRIVKRCFENRFVALADRVITVNAYCADLLPPSARGKLSIIDNGYDEVVLSRRRTLDMAPGYLHLVYAGSFMEDKDPTVLLSTIRSTELRNTIKLHHVGKPSRYVRPFLKDPFLVQHGVKSYEDTIDIINSCHAGLLLTGGEPFESLTKTFDYTGSFMGQMEANRQLAELMFSIARQVGRKAVALLSDMNQPLGNAVGNALEVQEALATLEGGGPEDFRQHCLTAASHMLVMGEICMDVEEGYERAQDAINNGSALAKFRQLVIAQGGDVSYVDTPGKFPKASLVETIHAPRHGFISQVNPRIVGETAVLLGAGRAKKGDPIDHAVCIIVHPKVGDSISKGQPVFTVHANDQDRLSQARQALELACQIKDEPVPPLPLFYGVIKGD